ncbi:antitoxin [Thermodesulfobacteriota bacterium]
MKTMTIRGLDENTAEECKKRAKDEGKSVNQFVLDTLKERLGLNKPKKYTVKYHDMDNLFGRWSANDFKRIQGKIDSERKIDKELW